MSRPRDPALRVPRAAAFLGVSTKTVYKLVGRDAVPYRRLPGTRSLVLFESELRLWLDGAELERLELPTGVVGVRPIEAPLGEAPAEVRARIEQFAAGKRFSLADFEALGARWKTERSGRVLLAFAGTSATGAVTAIKYRPVGGSSHDSFTEKPSVWLRPIVAGRLDLPDWIVAEGETEAARVHGLVGEEAAILCLPAGAATFRREWAAVIPRGATVYLAHDADRDGDAGARRVAALIGGRTVRVRPPDGAKDWCEWDGDRDAFVRLVAEAKARARSRVKSYDELLEQYAAERSGPEQEPVRTGFGSIDADLRGISAGQVLGIAARTAVGKTFALGTIGDTFAARRDSGSLTLSLEMPGAEWAERQLAIHADVAPEAVEQAARRGQLGPLAGDFLERMRNALVVDEPLALDALPDLLADARERLSVPLRLVLIDYLGLLDAQGRDAYERASALGKGLKLLAKAEQVSVVVAMQLSRAAGDGSEPVNLSQLRDSGVLEESLDFLLGCWRSGKASNLPPAEARELRDVMRVAILKNRKGEDGRTVDLRFRPVSRRLYEPAEAP